MSKVIVHIDLNAFYVRCEEIKDPSLINKPVAVGGNEKRGIICTCSYKAREYGVTSGMPLFQAKKLCPELIVKDVDWRFYNVLSNTFFRFVKKYTNLVEPMSCDECFADFTLPLKGVKDVMKYFTDFQNELYKKHQLKCSIGIATTKFLAKMASDMKKPMGITIIRNKDVKSMLSPLPIKDMFGIGKKTYPKLESINIKTIGDLIDRIEANDEQTKNHLGKFFYGARDWLSGKGDDTIYISDYEAKSVSCSTTFSEDTNSLEIIKGKFEWLCKEVSRRAKRNHQIGSTIQIVVKESNFNVHNKSKSLNNPTSDWLQLYNVAVKLFEDNFLDLNVRLVGVCLQHLVNQKDMKVQMSLFDFQQHEQESSTRLLINDINRKYNKTVLLRASEVKNHEDK